MGTGQDGAVDGRLGLIVAPLGLLCGSWLAERYARRGHDDANLRVLQIATLLVVPFSVAYPLASTPELALGLWAMTSSSPCWAWARPMPPCR